MPLSPCRETISGSEDFVSVIFNASKGATTPGTSREVVDVVGVEPDDVVVVVVDLKLKNIIKIEQFLDENIISTYLTDTNEGADPLPRPNIDPMVDDGAVDSGGSMKLALPRPPPIVGVDGASCDLAASTCARRDAIPRPRPMVTIGVTSSDSFGSSTSSACLF